LLLATAGAKTPIARIGRPAGKPRRTLGFRASLVLREVRAMDETAVNAILARILARDGDRNEFTPLGIDAVLRERERSRQPRLRLPLSQAKEIARRAMEVGLYEVCNLRMNSPHGALADFSKLEDKAGEASRAIKRVLQHLNPSARAGAEFELPIVTTIAVRPEVEGLDPQSLHALARQDGECLWRAREILDRLSLSANQKEAQVREARPASTKPEQSAFAKVLADCWIVLTGRAPGTNPNHDKNPFLEFLSSAWIDVFGHDETSDDPEFIGALRSLNFSEAEIDGICRDGPRWL
jgi:hypothetical protein